MNAALIGRNQRSGDERRVVVRHAARSEDRRDAVLERPWFDAPLAFASRVLSHDRSLASGSGRSWLVGGAARLPIAIGDLLQVLFHRALRRGRIMSGDRTQYAFVGRIGVLGR